MERLDLGFFYGTDADQFSFFRIPKLLITDRHFAGLSIEAKMLYGLLLDRMSLSRKNGWLDEEDRVYIYYTMKSIAVDMGISARSASRYMKELVNIGLIVVSRVDGYATKIYVLNFADIEESLSTEPEEDTDASDATCNDSTQVPPTDCHGVGVTNLHGGPLTDFQWGHDKLSWDPRQLFGGPLTDFHPSNTKYNNTEYNYTDLNNNKSLRKISRDHPEIQGETVALDDVVVETKEILQDFHFSDSDVLAILKAADQDLDRIREAVSILREQRSMISNPVGWLIRALKDHYSTAKPLRSKKQSRGGFHNFEERYSDTDWDSVERQLIQQQMIDRAKRDQREYEEETHWDGEAGEDEEDFLPRPMDPALLKKEVRGNGIV